MNKTHRVIWNRSRCAFIVAHECASSSGKPSTKRTAIAQGVAAAALYIAAGHASAQTVFMGSGQSVDNTTVITGTSGYPGVALGPGTTAGAITNSGLIQGSPTSGDDDQLDGIYVSGTLAGGITNSPTGAITGGQNGIAVLTAGSVTGVVNAGSINGGQYGIVVSASSMTGTITNSGSITGNNAGVSVQTNGTVVSIVNSGYIHGGSSGVSVNGPGASVSSIVNNGSLSMISGGSNGIFVGNGGSVGSINNAGTITSGAFGIHLINGTITLGITNGGLISGSDNTGIDLQNSTIGALSNLLGANITGSSAGLNAFGSSIGQLLNAGTISGMNGIVLSVSTVAGGITNSGLISGVNSSGISLLASTIGTLSNVLGGNITGGLVGLNASGSSLGPLLNAGMISGGYGMTLVNSTITGGLTNSGHISGTLYSGLTSTQSTITGGIRNLAGGVISGASGISLINTHLDTLLNAGTITGISQDGVAIFGTTITGIGSTPAISNSGNISAPLAGLFFDNATITGGVVNSGILSGATYAGIILAGTSLTGGITNLAGGVISGASGIAVFDGSIDFITNAAGATLTGIGGPFGGKSGILMSSATMLGGITNAGVIQGVNYGIVIESGTTIAGHIVNQGTITGSRVGVSIGSGSTLVGGLTNSGLIAGATAVGVTSVATVVGAISNLSGGTLSGAEGIYLYQGTVGSITNAAGAKIIATGTNGIDLSGSSTITGAINNAGTITAAAAGISMTTTAVVGGGITNSGVITGGINAILVSQGSEVVGDIVNAAGGVLDPVTAAAVALNNGTVTGQLINAGTITSSAIGIDLTNHGTIASGLVNTGLISGGQYAVYVDATSSLGPISISGKTASFVGDVYAPQSPVTVTAGSTFAGTNAFDVAAFTIDPTAKLIMGAMASTATNPAGITTTQGVSNAGTLGVGLNTAHITGSYTQQPGGTFSMGAKSIAQYGQLAVAGAVSLPSAANIFVNVSDTSVLPNKGTLVGVISGTSLTASTFDVTDNSALFAFKGQIDGNGVDLVISENALILPDVIANHNTAAVGAANVLDEIIETSGTTGAFGSVIDAFARLKTSQQVSSAASETLPLLSGDSAIAVLGTLYDVDHIVQSRTGNYGLSSGDPYMLSDRGVWVKPFGSWANQSDQNGAPGFNAQIAGVALGADGAWSPQGRVGLAFAYASTGVQGSGAQSPNSNHIDLYQFIGYGSYALDARTEVNWQLDGGMNNNTGSRSIALVGDTARSGYDSNTAHAGVGIGRSLPLSDDTVITPSLRVDYTWIHDDAYAEGGAGPLDLHVQAASLEQLLTSANAKITQRVSDTAMLYGNLGVGYDSLARGTQITAAFAGAPGLSFSTPGVGTRPWTGLGGLGFVYTPKGGPEITVGYDIAERSGFSEQSVSAKLRWAF